VQLGRNKNLPEMFLKHGKFYSEARKLFMLRAQQVVETKIDGEKMVWFESGNTNRQNL